jgi:hypothetical protein
MLSTVLRATAMASGEFGVTSTLYPGMHASVGLCRQVGFRV